MQGQNFGNGQTAPQGTLRVYLVDDESGIEFEGSTTTSGGNHNLECTDGPSGMGCLYTDTKIIFMVPHGSGRNLRIHVRVGNQDVYTDMPVMSYEGPLPSSLVPGTVSTGNAFMNAQGLEQIGILGPGMVSCWRAGRLTRRWDMCRATRTAPSPS
jgi:hypothetical protein